jgi:hypothetical protein
MPKFSVTNFLPKSGRQLAGRQYINLQPKYFFIYWTIIYFKLSSFWIKISIHVVV